MSACHTFTGFAQHLVSITPLAGENELRISFVLFGIGKEKEAVLFNQLFHFDYIRFLTKNKKEYQKTHDCALAGVKVGVVGILLPCGFYLFTLICTATTEIS